MLANISSAIAVLLRQPCSSLYSAKSASPGKQEELRQLKARLAQMEAEANKLRGHPEVG